MIGTCLLLRLVNKYTSGVSLANALLGMAYFLVLTVGIALIGCQIMEALHSDRETNYVYDLPHTSGQ